MEANMWGAISTEPIERTKSYVIVEEMICHEHELVKFIDNLCDEHQKVAVYAVIRWVGKKYPAVAESLGLEIYEQTDR